jgi:hypothetical protein
MNISSILEAVRPLADLSYEVIQTAQRLRRSAEYPLAFGFKDPLYNHTKGKAKQSQLPFLG